MVKNSLTLIFAIFLDLASSNAGSTESSSAKGNVPQCIARDCFDFKSVKVSVGVRIRDRIRVKGRLGPRLGV
jgi:hypothetical protein